MYVVSPRKLLENIWPPITTFKMEFGGIEGLLYAIVLLALPIVILFVLLKVLPPWKELREEGEAGTEAAGA